MKKQQHKKQEKKKKYTPPKLIKIGDVKSLTLKTGSTTDFGSKAFV